MMTIKSLLPPHRSELELAIEAVQARLGDVTVPVAKLWDAAQCPEALLPWLAWALSVDTWDTLWPVSVTSVSRCSGCASAVVTPQRRSL